VVLTGEQPLAGRNDYFPTGNPADWKTNIPTYGRVQYGPFTPESIWLLRARGRFEYDVDVAAGANPAAVRIALDGQSDARLNAKGDLLLKTGDREMRFLKPMAYQLAADGTRQPVEAGYRMKASTSSAKQAATVSFVVGKYDHARALVIDPVLVYGRSSPTPLQDLRRRFRPLPRTQAVLFTSPDPTTHTTSTKAVRHHTFRRSIQTEMCFLRRSLGPPAMSLQRTLHSIHREIGIFT